MRGETVRKEDLFLTWALCVLVLISLVINIIAKDHMANSDIETSRHGVSIEKENVMDNNNLEPCSKCGKTIAREVEDFTKPPFGKRFFIICPMPYGGCDCRTRDCETEEDARRRWTEMYNVE